MSDRTSAELFGSTFERIAAFIDEPDIPDPHKTDMREFADWFWEKMSDYDFSPYQMSADDALIKLGFARFYEEDGEKVIVYKGERDF